MHAETSAAAESSHTPLAFCVVVNWQGWQDTITCVESLLTQQYPSFRIVVVDNASADDSVERIRAAFPGMDVRCAPANRGYAAAGNLGIKVALEREAQFVWLLNNDIVAPPDTLCKLVSATRDVGVGMVGSVLRYMDKPDELQAWGGGSVARSSGYATHFRGPSALGEGAFLTFASVLLRSEMLEEIGLLDEGYFMYFEDSDLCFRARAAGWKLAVAADTAVLHKEGGSATTRKCARVDRIVTASGLRFLGRYGRPRGVAQVLFVLSRVGKRAVHGNVSGIRAVLRGVRDWRRGQPTAFQEEM